MCVFQPIFYNSSNFESIFLQRVRFWLSFFTTRQYFESKNIKGIRLRSEIVFQKNKVRWKTQFQKKIVSWSFRTVTTRKLTIFCSLEPFDAANDCRGEKKIKFQSKSSENNQILYQLFFKIRRVLNQDTLKVSVFEPKFLQLVLFWRDIFTACQSLSQQIYHSSDFEKNFFATRPIFHRWSKNVSDFKPIF